jgi:hypothetical protein
VQRLWALALAIVVALTALTGMSCARKPQDATPEGALEAFLRAVEETPNDPGAPARAYALLSTPTREALRARAVRATAITGKTMAPEAMLSPLWTPARFPVERTSATLEASGTSAVVEVFGVDPTTQHVRVPLVKEGDGWRIFLEIPEPQPQEP